MDRGALLARLREVARVSSGELGLAALLAAAVVGGSFVLFRRGPEPAPPPVRIERAAPTPSPSAPMLLVHVAGKVAVPGVYPLPEGSRVRDALAAAGGPAPGADPNLLNLAAPLSDGAQIVVPAQGAAPPRDGPAPAPGGAPVRVDLNAATQAQLEELPGVGPKLAERVLEYRRRHGRFRSTRDLLEVEGFGPRKVAALEEHVTVG